LGCALVFRREPPHELVFRIKNLKRHSARCRPKEIINHCSVRRVLSRRLFGRQWCTYKIIVVHPDGSSGMIKPCHTRAARLGCLAEWGNVVEDPEGTSMRRNDEGA